MGDAADQMYDRILEMEANHDMFMQHMYETCPLDRRPRPCKLVQNERYNENSDDQLPYRCPFCGRQFDPYL